MHVGGYACGGVCMREREGDRESERQRERDIERGRERERERERETLVSWDGRGKGVRCKILSPHVITA